jgi:hypothetical protein
MGGSCSTNGEKRKAREPERKRPLGRPRRRCVDNIRLGLGEVGWGVVDWIGLAQDRNRWRALVNSVLNLRVPRSAGKLSSGLTSSGLSSSARLNRVSLVSLINVFIVCIYSWSEIRRHVLIAPEGSHWLKIQEHFPLPPHSEPETKRVLAFRDIGFALLSLH